MGLSIKHLSLISLGPRSDTDNPNISPGFEEVTEAMAERLADRTPKLLKGLDALQKKARTSQRDVTKLRIWADKENQELLNLKETIRERRDSYIKTLSVDARACLAVRHPVWVSTFNMYLDQIQDLFAIHKDGRAVVKCTLKANTLKALKIYYYASCQTSLCINSDQVQKYVSDETPIEGWAESQQGLTNTYPSNEYIFRSVAGGHAQWIFTGNRWGIENYILWLDFGKPLRS
jgi:hypothetical protein